MLNVKVSGEYEFIHRSNSRGTTNYISLNSNVAKFGGVVVTEGRHVKLPCKVEGIPEPEVYWISPTDENFAQGQKEGKHVASKGKMHIKSSTMSDNGWWWCVAKSKFYFEYLPIRLTVLPRYSFKLDLIRRPVLK